MSPAIAANSSAARRGRPCRSAPAVPCGQLAVAGLVASRRPSSVLRRCAAPSDTHSGGRVMPLGVGSTVATCIASVPARCGTSAGALSSPVAV
eukprot:593755-Pleurochrysis_carterae.AAC.1